MFFYPSKFRGSFLSREDILRLFTLFILLMLAACGGDSSSLPVSSSENKGGISLPKALKTDLQTNGTLSAYITVDGGVRQQMIISGDNAGIDLDNITQDNHQFVIEFEFLLDTNPASPIMLARTKTSLDVGPGTNTLTVAETDYVTAFDEDDDGDTNILELANNTSPFAGFRISLISGNTSEAGASANFSVALTRQPTTDVTINLSSSNINEGILSRNVITFTVDNWNIDQVITVSGVDDNSIDGNSNFIIELANAVSNDINYNSQIVPDVPVINIDNDSGGFNVSPISNDTDENGRTATFTIQLNTQPTGAVNISLRSSDTSEGIIDKTNISFTTNNWNIPQVITVTGQDDNIDDDLQNYQIVLSSVISSDVNYNGLVPGNVAVVNLDNDNIPVITLSVNTLSVRENGGAVVITATLNIASAQDVAINFGYSGTAVFSTDYIAATRLVIVAGRLSGAIDVTAIQDNISEADESIVIDIASATNSVKSGTQQPLEIIILEDKFTISGGLTGLVSGELVIQNNGVDDLIINVDGNFTFASGLSNDSTYNVTVKTPPPNQTCVIQNASGTVSSANVASLLINCFASDLMKATAGSQFVSLSGNLIDGATTYNIYYSTTKGFNPDVDATVISNVSIIPVVVNNLNNGTAYYFVLEIVFGNEVVRLAEISSRPNEWSFNGSVNAMDVDTADNTLYVGGDFTSVGPYMGNSIPLKVDNGELAWGDFPVVEGRVFATLSDGTGGWYIGGDFNRAGGAVHNGLVHILNDQTVDANWNPSVSGVVYALGISANGSLYVGGDFTDVNGSTRNNLAELSAAGLVTSWNPNVTSVAPNVDIVRSLAASANQVYIAGQFSTVGGLSRNNLAAINISDGVITDWNPDANNAVNVLILVGNTAYIGGDFTKIGGSVRNHLAAILLNVAIPTVPTAWNPGADATVNALAGNSTTIYAGGTFTTINGSSRAHIAAIAADASGTLEAWNPAANNMDGVVNALVINGNSVYVGGLFSVISNLNRNNLLHISFNGSIDLAYPDANARVSTMALSAETLYVGGPGLTTIGAITRNYLAAISSSGELIDWNPNANDVVNALVVADNIYIGGGFTTIGGIPRNHVAAIRSAIINNGIPNTWNPSANDIVYTIDISGTTVYVGGDFTTIGSNPRNRLAAIDINGTIDLWNPAVDSRVRALIVNGTNVYIGGDFSSITDTNGVSAIRNRLAAIGTNGVLDVWNPDADANINTMAASGNTIYIGGDFVTLDSSTAVPVTRNRLAAIGTDGVIAVWNPNADLPVKALLVDLNTVYLAGDFTTIGGVARANHLAAVDDVNGTLNNVWTSAVHLTPKSLTLNSSTIYVGGISEFTNGFATIGTDGTVR